MNNDDLLRQIRATRDEFAEAHGYDVRAMVAFLRELDAAGDRQVVRLAPRPVARPGSAARPNQEPAVQPASSVPGKA